MRRRCIGSRDGKRDKHVKRLYFVRCSESDIQWIDELFKTLLVQALGFGKDSIYAIILDYSV